MTATVVDGHHLTLSHLDKALYSDGFTKAQVIDYYVRVAPVLLPHLAGRPVTRVRFPDGTAGPSFFEKNVPASTPRWIARQLVASTAGGTAGVDYPLVTDTATLVYLANLASIEFHAPLWTSPTQTPVEWTNPPLNTQLVVDLDPACDVSTKTLVTVALVIANRLAADGLTPLPRSSGRTGLQVYCAIAPSLGRQSRDYIRQLATDIADHVPVTTSVATSARHGKVFVDYNQNLSARTMVAPYSLRGTATPQVATPLTWEEVAAATRPAQLHCHPDAVLDRVTRYGDLAASLLTASTTVVPQSRPTAHQ